MSQVTRHYPVQQRTNYEADLQDITIPQGNQIVNFLQFIGDTKTNQGVITFVTPGQELEIWSFRSNDGGTTWQQLSYARWLAPLHDHFGNAIDPSVTTSVDPPLGGGTLLRVHVKQVGTYRLGGDIIGDYTTQLGPLAALPRTRKKKQQQKSP